MDAASMAVVVVLHGSWVVVVLVLVASQSVVVVVVVASQSLVVVASQAVVVVVVMAVVVVVLLALMAVALLAVAVVAFHTFLGLLVEVVCTWRSSLVRGSLVVVVQHGSPLALLHRSSRIVVVLCTPVQSFLVGISVEMVSLAVVDWIHVSSVEVPTLVVVVVHVVWDGKSRVVVVVVHVVWWLVVVVLEAIG